MAILMVFLARTSSRQIYTLEVIGAVQEDVNGLYYCTEALYCRNEKFSLSRTSKIVDSKVKKVWYLTELKPPFEGYRYTYASVQLDGQTSMAFETWRSQGADGPIYDEGMSAAVVPVTCSEVDVYSICITILLKVIRH